MLKPLLKSLLPASVLSDRASQNWYREQRQNRASVEQSLAILGDRWGFVPSPCADRPVFIFSALWRSGSTLVQRLINSDPQILVWGEPYHKGNFVQVLSESVRSFTATFPSADYFIDSANFAGSEKSLDRRWTANLYPELEAFVAAQRAFFQTLYGQPAQKRGFGRWGLKEVRLDIHHAIYLHWLFPQAKFIFLYRNPYKAYASCHTWRDLYLQWPEVPIATPEQFGAAWRSLVLGYRSGADRVGGLLLPYEAFCQGQPSVAALGEYLELNLDPEVMTRKIGSQDKKTPLAPWQIQRLQKAADPLARELGYTGS